LARAVSRQGRLEIQRVDGCAVHESPLAATLREAGFGSTPRGMVVYPETRGA
jgi:hypothetical protein